MSRSTATLEVHDFRRPRQLTPAAWRAMQQWCAAGCKLVCEHWKRLGLDVTLTCEDRGVRTLSAVLEMTPEPGWGVHGTLGATSIDTLLVGPPQRLRGLVTRLMGDPFDAKDERDSLTAVEESMAELLMGEFLQAFSDAWPGPEPLGARIVDVLRRPQRTRLFSPGTTFAVIAFSLDDRPTPGEESSVGHHGDSHPGEADQRAVADDELLWIVPQEPLEDLIEIECAPQAVAPSKPHPGIARVVHEMPVSVVVELGRTYLTMSELTSLQAGDVVVLEQSVIRPLNARVGNTFKFCGRPGRNGAHRCFEILQVLEESAGPIPVSLPVR